MKQPYDTTPPPPGPTPSDIGRWPVSLFDVHARLAPRFARSEPRRRAWRYLQAVISDIPRKNGWQIAEHAKEARPYDEVGGQRGVAIPSDLSDSFLTVS